MTATIERQSERDTAGPDWVRLASIAIGIVALAVIPYVVNSYWMFLAQSLAVNFIAASALNVLTGNTGQFSLGNAAFLAIGAYTGAFFWAQLKLPFVVAFVAAAVVGAIAGAIVGLPALRLRGIYLLMSTLAAHYLVIFVVGKYQEREFGLAGASLPAFGFGPLSQGSQKDLYFLCAICAVVVGVLLHNLMRGAYGRATVSVRNRDAAAAACGVQVGRTKLVIWSVTSSVVSVAGLLQAASLGTATSDFYTLGLAISFVAMIIVGGLGSIWGSLAGAIFVTATPEVIHRISDRFGSSDPLHGGILSHPFELQEIAYGLAIVLFVLLAPEGIAGLIARAFGFSTRLAPRLVRRSDDGVDRGQ